MKALWGWICRRRKAAGEPHVSGPATASRRDAATCGGFCVVWGMTPWGRVRTRRMDVVSVQWWGSMLGSQTRDASIQPWTAATAKLPECPTQVLFVLSLAAQPRPLWQWLEGRVSAN